MHGLCVPKRCTAEANQDEMQLPLDDRATRWVSHWADQYCTQWGYSPQSRMATVSPHCNMAQTSNTAAEEVAQLHDTVGASMVTILWQPTWMWFSRIFCLFFFFLHFLQTLTGSTGATNSLQLFCDSFQGQFVRIFNVCSLGETYLAFLFRSLAFLLRVRWTDRFNSHVCRLKVQNVCEEI